jgi:hypothetical protein
MIIAGYSSNENTFRCTGCQSIGSFAYRELEKKHPRVVVGLTDISERNSVRPALGNNVMSITTPWPFYLRMEENVEGSFLQHESWLRLRQERA